MMHEVAEPDGDAVEEHQPLRAADRGGGIERGFQRGPAIRGALLAVRAMRWRISSSKGSAVAM
jgi:hypothetical protein